MTYIAFHLNMARLDLVCLTKITRAILKHSEKKIKKKKNQKNQKKGSLDDVRDVCRRE
jgi:hypothetical protein